jgi:hypothetical protein
MTKRIRFPALVGSHPLAALASFGLLRWVSETDPTAKLAFVLEDDWMAILESDRLESSETLMSALSAWVESAALDRVLGWAEKDVRVRPSDYRQALSRALIDDDLLLASFLSALVADGAQDSQKGLIKPGAFYMVSGQQSFLKGARDIVAAVRKNALAAFREALCGPWSYSTDLHGLGWDPNTERLYALRHRAPTSEKATCVAGAVVLAIWALPLYPTVSHRGRASTIGFTRVLGEQHFSWPIFSTPIDISTLKSLIHVGESGWRSNAQVLRDGIEACYRSRRFEFGQGYAVLRAAEVICQRSYEQAPCHTGDLN